MSHLPDQLRQAATAVPRRIDGRLPTLEEQERDYIRFVLQQANGNQTAAANILGINRASLWRKLKGMQG